MKKETKEEIISRLTPLAGNIVNMINDVCKQNSSLGSSLLYASGLAGYACKEAIKDQGKLRIKIKTNDDLSFYFGEEINNYLIKNDTSIYSFCSAVTDMPKDEMYEILSNVSNNISIGNLYVGDKTASSVYSLIKPYFEGIFDNMTNAYCKSSDEWPILYGIVLQQIIKEEIDKGNSPSNIRLEAMECVAIISRMDHDSLPDAKLDESVLNNRKLIKKACGTNAMAEGIIYSNFVIWIVLISAFTIAMYYSGGFTYKELIEVLPLVGFIIVFVLFIYLYIIISNNKHKKYLEEKYDNLTRDEKVELLNSIKDTNSQRKLYLSKTFIYGNCNKVRKQSNMPAGLIAMEFFKPEDVKMFLASSHRFFGRNFQTNTLTKECHIYTVDGSSLISLCDDETYKIIVNRIKSTNPKCIIK